MLLIFLGPKLNNDSISGINTNYNTTGYKYPTPGVGYCEGWGCSGVFSGHLVTSSFAQLVVKAIYSSRNLAIDESISGLLNNLTKSIHESRPNKLNWAD